MIQANAKCIVNGDKVNETIMAVNSLMNVDIVVGNVDEPQVKYFPEGFLIVLPRGSSYTNEELYYVDANNDVASRWFVTSTTQASTSPVSTSGIPTGKQSTSQPRSKDRNSLGNTPSNTNRDQLTTGGALLDSSGSGGVAPTGNVTGGGGALRDDGSRPANQGGGIAGGMADDGQTAEQSRANFLANKQRAAGTTPAPSGVAGGMADDGQTAEQSRTNFLANQQRAADTTPAPLPGAPPQGGDTTPAPLPGAPPQGGGATPPPTPGAPPLSGDEPTTRTPRPSSSMPMMAAGTDLSQSLPNKNGGVDMRTLGNMVAEGVASPYQEQFYNDAMSSAGGGDAGNAASDSTINDRFIQSEHDLYSENIKRIQQIVAQQGGDINVYLESFNRVFEAGYEERRRRFFDQAFKK